MRTVPCGSDPRAVDDFMGGLDFDQHSSISTSIAVRIELLADGLKEACDSGFMINLSADSLEEADDLANLNIAPVAVVVPPHQTARTPKGRTVTICPARRKKGITCSMCQFCTKPHKAIIAFPQL
jgi:hypothetical protein